MPQPWQEIVAAFWEAVAWKKGGEVVLRSGSETGRVFFVEGKIAWAVASTVKRTFLAYLVEETWLSRDQLHEVFESCRHSGANFAEALVERGLIDEHQLRALLLQHLGECLLSILCWPELNAMFVPESRSYKGTLTFELAEALQTVLALDHESRLPFTGCSVDEILGQARARGAAPPEEPLPAAVLTTMKVIPQRRWMTIAAVVGPAVLLIAAGLLYAFWRRTPPQAPAAGTRVVPRRNVATRQPVKRRAADARASASQGTPPAVVAAEKAAARSDGRAASAASQPTTGEEAGIVVGAAGEGKGAVRVLSRPGRARIYLDGLDTGRSTPQRMREVLAGVEHVIMLERRGFAPAIKRFKLAAAMEATLRFALSSQRRAPSPAAPATIRLVSEPAGAAVHVNRRSRDAVTPTEVPLDPVRPSLVEVQLSCFRSWRQRIRPIPGVPLTYRITLQRSCRGDKPSRRRAKVPRRAAKSAAKHRRAPRR